MYTVALDQHASRHAGQSRAVRGCLLPVQVNELDGDVFVLDNHRICVVLSLLHANISQRHEQGELVGRGEVSLTEQPLELSQKFQLRFRRGHVQ